MNKEKWLFRNMRGWHQIIIEALDKIEAISKEYDVDISIYDIKEKYATLRIDVRGTYDQEVQNKLNAVIISAEKKSEVTCMHCGKRGTLRTVQGWLLTLCDDCNERKKQTR